jgi:hypothetical protein
MRGKIHHFPKSFFYFFLKMNFMNIQNIKLENNENVYICF